jgi:hypothetical protein
LRRTTTRHAERDEQREPLPARRHRGVGYCRTTECARRFFCQQDSFSSWQSGSSSP